MTTIFATWDRKRQRWKFRDCVNLGSKGMARRRRNFHCCAKLFIRVPDEMVRRLKRYKLAQNFYEWQKQQVIWSEHIHG